MTHFICPNCGCEFEGSVPECPSCLTAFYSSTGEFDGDYWAPLPEEVEER